MPQTVLLTGITGYIAKHIALQLISSGHRVRGSLRDIKRQQEVINALRPHLPNGCDADKQLEFCTLDLSSDAGWAEAMSGIDVVMHTASPFPLTQPKDESDLIRPAVDGTLRALRAAQNAGVSRVILTSSTVAISGSELPTGDAAFDETNWTDPDDPSITPYAKSKTLAERAAWDFVQGSAPEIDLTVINPGFVMGAPLDDSFGTSLQVIQRILRAKDPMLPNIGFASVDVRDVAAMHIAAMNSPATIGQRIMTVDRFLSFQDIAKAIKAAHPDRRIVTRVAPDAVIRFLALFDPALKSIVPSLGRVDKMDNARAKSILGRGMYQAPKAAAEAARYLIERDLV